jgi:hypothetical protein
LGKRSFKQDKSGQVIIVSALLVALILLSTALYVIEVGKEVPTVDASQGNVFSDYKQAATNTLISALANATNGGTSTILGTDLSELKTILLSNSYQALLTMDYSILNSSYYQNGIWISWGADGHGVSSIYASFAFASYSPSASSNVDYSVNVTTAVNLSGNIQQLNETTKQVNLTVNVSNEDKAALAQNFAFSYQNETDWVDVNYPNITSFGNGTYAVSFNAQTPQVSDPLVVSLKCQDQRGIFVGANLTCTSM